MRRLAAAAIAVLCAVQACAGGVVRADTPAPGQYRAGELDAVRNVLPAGQNGHLNLVEALTQTSDSKLVSRLSSALPPGTQVPGYPVLAPHQEDQLPLYKDPLTKSGRISSQDLQADFKDASFGVPAGQVASSESPRPDLTIIRDKQFGVPHVYGATDDATVFGAGYIMGEDRLFLSDVLRHYGRSTLSSIIGSSGIPMDCAQAQLTGYSEQELDEQITQLGNAPSGEPYRQLAQRYVDGINAYIDAAVADPVNKLPAEYVAFHMTPQHWVIGDITAIAGLVGGIFGKGGGVETRNAAFLRSLRSLFPGDSSKADKIFRDFMENDDPEAPTTIDQPFPYENDPHPDPNAVALTSHPPRDPVTASCTESPTPSVGASGPNLTGPGSSSTLALTALHAIAALQRAPKAMSNALLVGAAHSSTGRPIAVMGPQVAYFEPEILMEEDLHGPSFDVRGASFPGTNFVVQLGHGPDYAWSATSAGTDNIDQYSELLCNPAGGPVDPNSTSYMYRGRCVPMEERSESEFVPPSPGSTPPPAPFVGTLTIKIERTVHGPVLDRTTALVNGREVPVAVSSKRSTFLHEADSVAGFIGFDNPATLRSPSDFLAAASQIQYTFNWFYADNAHIAYYQSGRLPVRPRGVDPDLPTWGTGQWEWQGWLASEAHPHAVDPAKGFITSWNNKGAPQFRASDDQWSYGPVFRSQSLDDAIQHYLASQGGTMSLTDLVNAMETAASVDLPGTRDLPLLLQLVQSDPSVAPQVQLLQGWLSRGAHRIDTAGSGAYDDIKAIRLFDAWYPLLLHAIFEPTLQSAFGAVPEEFDDSPTLGLGSSYIEGWYGYVDKALRMSLGQSVTQPYSQTYCGQGSRAACSAALSASLKQAATAPSAPTACQTPSATDAAYTRCDDIVFTVVGLQESISIPWQNRPTFQQAVDVPGHRP